MINILNDSAYTLVKSDPTNKIRSEVSALIKTSCLPESVRYRLIHSGCNMPRIYVLPKIHKPGIPLRPTVGTIGSPTYDLQGRALKWVVAELDEIFSVALFPPRRNTCKFATAQCHKQQ